MKKKKINRKSLYVSLVLIVVFIAFLSIVYAALSETLTISGNAEVQAASWNIYFTKSDTVKTGTATYTEPVIDGTTLRDYTISLKKPGDAVEFNYNIWNESPFSAQIDAILNSTPVCTSSTGNEEDEKAICDNLNITLDINGAQIGDLIGNSNYGSVLCKNGETVSSITSKVKLTISLNNTSSAYVGSNVTISNLKNEIVLSASNIQCSVFQCFVAGTKVLTNNGYKNIEDIKVGDYVYSINKYGQRELKHVYYKYNKTAKNLRKIQVGREIITVTPEHRIYVIGKGYVRADSIKKGDKLYGIKDGFVVYNQELKYNEEIPVYNMEVNDNHNYLITESEFLVHNGY